MNPDFRKVALAAATLGLLVSLYFALRPSGSDDIDTSATTTTAPAATTAPPATTTAPPATTTAPAPTTTAPPAAPRPAQVRIAVVGGRPVGGIRRASVKKGRRVAITVTSDLADEIHLHGYDVSAPVAPGKPARLTLTADVPGRFELEFEQRGIPIAELEVRP